MNEVDKLQLDQLPVDVLNEIAKYMHISDVMVLRCCNRRLRDVQWLPPIARRINSMISYENYISTFYDNVRDSIMDVIEAKVRTNAFTDHFWLINAYIVINYSQMTFDSILLELQIRRGRYIDINELYFMEIQLLQIYNLPTIPESGWIPTLKTLDLFQKYIDPEIIHVLYIKRRLLLGRLGTLAM